MPDNLMNMSASFFLSQVKNQYPEVLPEFAASILSVIMRLENDCGPNASCASIAPLTENNKESVLIQYATVLMYRCSRFEKIPMQLKVMLDKMNELHDEVSLSIDAPNMMSKILLINEVETAHPGVFEKIINRVRNNEKNPIDGFSVSNLECSEALPTGLSAKLDFEFQQYSAFFYAV